jgi:hypothetical protein
VIEAIRVLRHKTDPSHQLYMIRIMADVLLPCFIAEKPLSTFFDTNFETTFENMPSTTEIAILPPITVAPYNEIPVLPSIAAPRKSVGRPKKRKAIEITREEPTPIDPPGELLTQEERDLRIAEASILFPKYMASQNAKRVKLNADNKSQSGTLEKGPLLYLPTSEYSNSWHPYYRCSPTSDPKTETKVNRYFEMDCRNPGQPIARNFPNEIEMNPLYYDLEWNQRISPIRPDFITPPERGTLPYVFSSKKINNPENRVHMDSFILALRREMGEDYFDLNSVRYFPRSNGRVETFHDDKTRKLKCMKNGHLDVDTFLRNREIERHLETIKIRYLLKRVPWTDEIEQYWDERITKFVNPYTVCKGRTFFSMQDDIGIEDDRYCAPEKLDKAVYEPPPGANESELGKSLYWSVKTGRMVSVDELRRERQEIQENDVASRDLATVETGSRTRSQSRSPNQIYSK